MTELLSNLTYTCSNFDRVFEPLAPEQIQRGLSSAISRVVVFQPDTLSVLFSNGNYLHTVQSVQSTFNIDLNQQYAEDSVSVLGFLGDATVYLFRTAHAHKDFIQFYNAQYGEFDRLSQLIGFAFAITRFLWQFNFCPRCQKKLTFQSTSKTYLKCEHCKIEFYPQITPAIIAMITCGDEVLICHRRQNIYTHISGFIETVETAEQALYREIEEEIHIKKHQIKEVIPYAITQPWPGQSISLMLPYRVELHERVEFTPSAEIKDAKWIKRANFRAAASRADTDAKDDWVCPGRKAVARYMLETFFSTRKDE